MNKTANDLMYAIALRARELADSSMAQLRRERAGYDCDDASIGYAQQLTRGQTRGEMIEFILTEEFELDAKTIDDNS